MLQTARDAVTLGPALFREQLIAYLEESEFTRRIAAIRATSDPGEWLAALGSADGRDSLTKLLGACRRGLEDDPGHPGLLVLAGTCRLALFGPGGGEQDVRGGFTALRRFAGDATARVGTAARLLEYIGQLAPSCQERALAAMAEGDPTREMTRFCYERATPDSPLHHTTILALARGLAATLTRRRGTDERTGAED